MRDPRESPLQTMVLLDPGARNSLEIRTEYNFSMPKSHRALTALGGAGKILSERQLSFRTL